MSLKADDSRHRDSAATAAVRCFRCLNHDFVIKALKRNKLKK
jgi:hypothetical protein